MELVEEEKKSEIIIVRRSGNLDDDEHHGGVWKIAYADFMTAMMAFFLVMWLVNVASDDTKQAVANYFNPIKLVDSQPQPRGVSEEVTPDEKPVEDDKNQKPSGEHAVSAFAEEAKMLDEPYGALETIALLDRQDGYIQGNEGSEQGGQMSPVERTQLRDPFSPQYWEGNAEIEDMPEITQSDPLKKITAQQPIEGEENAQTGKKVGEQEEGGQEAKSVNEEAQSETEIMPEIIQVAETVAEDARNLMQEVMQDHDERPQMDVHASKNEIVIELTDTQNFGMFAVGSAKPEAHIVSLLEGLAKIIDKYPGDVVVSGYTDARPYKNTAHYDNWQLSAARAQMAHYMLVRGGLDEARILKVEGYADRRLRNSQDAYAAENRRIAIILKQTGKDRQAKENPETSEQTEERQARNDTREENSES